MAILEKVIAAIAPHQCLSCGVAGDLLCGQCLSGLQTRRRPACFGCNKFSPYGRTCENCRRTRPVTGVTVGTYYEEPLREFMARVKYERAGSQAALGVVLLAPQIYAEEFDVVCWVPSVPRRARQRGYNQAEVLARALARELKLPAKRLLARKSGESQVGKSRASRLKQISGQFFATRQPKGERVLLVDDVLTTGATLGECARTLKRAGAKSVWGAVFARH